MEGDCNRCGELKENVNALCKSCGRFPKQPPPIKKPKGLFQQMPFMGSS